MINIKKKYIVAVRCKEKGMPVVYYFKAKNDQEVKRRMYEEFKDVLDQIEGIDYDQAKFTKHNHLLCGNCTSAGRLKEMFEKKYIIRDEAKEMVEELFNKITNYIDFSKTAEELLNVKKKVGQYNELKFGTKDNPYQLIAGTEFYAMLVDAGIADPNKKVDLVCIKDCWFKIVSTENVDKEKAYIPDYATCETIECKIEPLYR